MTQNTESMALIGQTWFVLVDFKHIGEKKIFKEGLEYSRAVS
jgi:hypothetical protein